MDTKRKTGRPKLKDSERLVVVSVRMTEWQRLKYRSMPDGPERLRKWVERAKV